MTQDPLTSGGADQQKETFGANELRWNPFLMHYGTPILPEPGSRKPFSRLQSVKIKREYVRKEKFDRPDASWKKMYLAHSTRLDFRAHVECRTMYGVYIRNYRSSDDDENMAILTMEFLKEIERKCFEGGHQSMGDEIFLSIFPS